LPTIANEHLCYNVAMTRRLNPPFTSETARAAVNKRWEAYRRQAVQQITKEAQAIDPTVTTGAAAFGLVASKQYAALMDSDKPRIADLERLGVLMTGKQDAENPSRANVPAGEISAAPAAVIELLTLLEAHMQAEREKARAIDSG
jgi:hypothetical protein